MNLVNVNAFFLSAYISFVYRILPMPYTRVCVLTIVCGCVIREHEHVSLPNLRVARAWKGLKYGCPNYGCMELYPFTLGFVQFRVMPSI